MRLLKIVNTSDYTIDEILVGVDDSYNKDEFLGWIADCSDLTAPIIESDIPMPEGLTLDADRIYQG